MMAETGYFFVRYYLRGKILFNTLSLLSAIAFIESIDATSLTIDPALFNEFFVNILHLLTLQGVWVTLALDTYKISRRMLSG